jgi:hypothetical protein
VIPAYSLNVLLGKIPIVGNIFNRGAGIIAVDYELSGAIDDPDIDVEGTNTVTPDAVERFEDPPDSDKKEDETSNGEK